MAHRKEWKQLNVFLDASLNLETGNLKLETRVKDAGCRVLDVGYRAKPANGQTGSTG